MAYFVIIFELKKKRESAHMAKEIVVFASGTGSNFQSILQAIKSGYLDVSVRCLITDRPCNATNVAVVNGISHYVLPRQNDEMLNLQVMAMLCHEIDLIVCVGYLSILNPHFVNLFPKRIINIHPSLLPKFGGYGMYGKRVHQAVIDARETESGCTVHYLDSGIDTGEIIAQETVSVSMLDDADSLQAKVLAKEHELLPRVIKSLLER